MKKPGRNTNLSSLYPVAYVWRIWYIDKCLDLDKFSWMTRPLQDPFHGEISKITFHVLPALKRIGSSCSCLCASANSKRGSLFRICIRSSDHQSTHFSDTHEVRIGPIDPHLDLLRSFPAFCGCLASSNGPIGYCRKDQADSSQDAGRHDEGWKHGKDI